MTDLVPIPQPPPHLWGLLGNAPELTENPILSETFARLYQKYGEIFKLVIPGKPSWVVVSSQALSNEVCDESRFEKYITASLLELRPFLKDALFTAYSQETNWKVAHKLLMPVFGPIGIRKMFPQMKDIASQMILKWDRLGPNHEIDLSDDCTRLAFDTIGICAFSYRFNDFYSEDMHPFAIWMADILIEAGKRMSRTGIEQSMRIWSAEKYQEDIKKTHELCDKIIAQRKAHPEPDNHDLLNVMLNGKDEETGLSLPDEAIRHNMATFLVAGHETTSGTLTFCIHNLLKNPEALAKARAEVDEVVGDDDFTLKHIPKLSYVDACLKETLRVDCPITRNHVHAKEDTTLSGKYAVSSTDQIVLNLRSIHKDPTVWGPNAEEYRPERMLNGGFDKLPANAWKPFGNGMRGCIGRSFAWQEMMMVMGLILQRFDLQMADPSYVLKLKSTLTVKPVNFRIKASRRPGKSDWVGLYDQSTVAEVK